MAQRERFDEREQKPKQQTARQRVNSAGNTWATTCLRCVMTGSRLCHLRALSLFAGPFTYVLFFSFAVYVRNLPHGLYKNRFGLSACSGLPRISLDAVFGFSMNAWSAGSRVLIDVLGRVVGLTGTSGSLGHLQCRVDKRSGSYSHRIALLYGPEGPAFAHGTRGGT